MADVWLISGIPGAGKSRAGRLLATRLPRAAFIEGDLLQGWIVSGNVWPGSEPREESERQMLLNVRHQCLLARSFSEAGFVPVIDYVVVTRRLLAAYREQLAGLELHVVVLHPGRATAIERDAGREKSRVHKERHGRSIGEHFAPLEEVMLSELAGVGLWVDNAHLTPEDTVDRILEGRPAART